MTDQNCSKIIEEHPIGNGLNTFRNSFNSICEDGNISPDPGAIESILVKKSYRILFSSFSPHYNSIQPPDCSVQVEMAKTSSTICCGSIPLSTPASSILIALSHS
ncbi:hypothetical protein V2G26_007763 [Clonostachys chloroleuca]